MTEILIKIINLPVAIQRAIATLFLSMFLILVLSLVWGIVTALEQQADKILDKRQLLARLDETIVRGEGEPDHARRSAPSKDLLPGGSEALAQAGLQTKLGAITATTGVTVLSTAGIRTVEYEGVKYIGLQATLQGKLTAIHETLFQLESAKPYLLVREITIRSTNSSPNGALLAPVELSVQLSFFGAINPALNTQLEVARP